MFAMFAMTTDSVGLIIPEIIRAFRLSLTAAGTFQYTTMTGIAFVGASARTARRPARPAARRSSPASRCSPLHVPARRRSLSSSSSGLLVLSGLAIGMFKTGALALIGDISTSTGEHTTTMNTVEGYFGVGAMIGPAIVARLLTAGLSWTVALHDRRDDLRPVHGASAAREVSGDPRHPHDSGFS